MYNNADKHLKELTDLNQYKSEDDTATEPKGFSDDDLDGFLIGVLRAFSYNTLSGGNLILAISIFILEFTSSCVVTDCCVPCVS